MAPSNPPAYAKDERVLCFHHELLYEAKVLGSKPTDASDKKSPHQYRVHYKGWKNTWDDWVPQDRLRKFTEENKELALNLKKEMDALRNAAPRDSHQKRPSQSAATTSHKKRQSVAAGATTGGSDFSSARGSEERHSSTQPHPTSRGQKRNRDFETEREEAFQTRPSIRLLVPDSIKALLVDDWENVTKNLQLVRLPSAHPVNAILAAYLGDEQPKRTPGSAEADILEEVVQGVREYFDKSLGRILLYRFERDQYFAIRALWDGPKAQPERYAGPGDVYGAEHLCRLFVSMPELIAQTNMDQQSVNRLREELARMTQWLARGSDKWVSGVYEEAGSDYVEKARGV